jgi:phosphatidylserine/phosphatidylglycerophosphate/cardiolipin synthase-like enzyme
MTNPSKTFAAMFAAIFLLADIGAESPANAQPKTYPVAAGSQRTLCSTPVDDCEKMLEEGIRSAKSLLAIAVDLVTAPRLLASLKDAQARGVDIRLLLDRRIRDADRGEIAALAAAKPSNVRISEEDGLRGGLMIVDGAHVVIGGYSMIRAEEREGYQNALVVSGDDAFTRLAAQEFIARWSKSAPLLAQ